MASKRHRDRWALGWGKAGRSWEILERCGRGDRYRIGEMIRKINSNLNFSYLSGASV
jgi:hypothetical protein